MKGEASHYTRWPGSAISLGHSSPGVDGGPMTGEMSSGSSPYPTECMDRLRRAVVFRKDPFANSPDIHLFLIIHLVSNLTCSRTYKLTSEDIMVDYIQADG